MLDLDVDARARLGRDDLLGGPAQQRDVLGEQVVVEVAHDRADRRRAGGALDRVDVDEALAVGRRLGREPVLRQRGEDAAREPRRVDELARGDAGMDVDAGILTSADAAVNVSSVNSPASEPSSV